MKKRNGSCSPGAQTGRGREVWPSHGGFRVFLIRLAASYFGLLLLWYPGGEYYRRSLIHAGNLLVPFLAPGTEISFRPRSEWWGVDLPSSVDLGVLARKQDWLDAGGHTVFVLAKPISTFYQPFMAVAFLLALLLATKTTWRRRAVRGALALGLLHLWMLLGVTIDVSHAITGFVRSAGGDLEWGRVAVGLLHHSITDWPMGVFVVPLLIWVMVCRPPGIIR